MTKLNNLDLRQLSEEELEKYASMVTEYINLVLEFSKIERGVGWKPEFAEKEKKLKMRISELRNLLGMVPINFR